MTDDQSIKIVEDTLDNEINPKIVAKSHQIRRQGERLFRQVRLPRQQAWVRNASPAATLKSTSVLLAKPPRSIPVMCARTVKDESVPVISPIGADENGMVLNINADIAAAAFAATLKASKLIYVSDVPGIMRNPAAPDSAHPHHARRADRDPYQGEESSPAA